MYANLTEVLPQKRLPDFASLWRSRSDTARAAKCSSHAAALLADIESQVGSQSINITELVDTVIEAVATGATLGELTACWWGAPKARDSATPIVMQRRTEAYETLRQKAAERVSRTGQAPTVFLANMGPLRQHKARADFAVGFFQPGGFSVINPDGFDSVENAVNAALASGAPIVVICSTDDTYPELVPAFTEQIRKQNAGLSIVVAGYPKEHAARFQELGVDEFIHLKADNLQILMKLQAIAGA